MASSTPKKKIREIYKRMIRRFGPQGWWPTTPRSGAHPVYVPHQSPFRLTENQRFEICLGAFLTQNTNWTNVTRVLSLLKEKGVLRFERLSRLPKRSIEKYFRSSGYFRQKAERVIHFMNKLRREAGGRLRFYFRGTNEALREKLLALKGVGPETADSILLYAAGRPFFVVDAYTRRVAQRWGMIKGRESYEEIQMLFATALPKSNRLFGEYHALIVQLAKKFCRKVPICGPCPVRSLCAYGRNSLI